GRRSTRQRCRRPRRADGPLAHGYRCRVQSRPGRPTWYRCVRERPWHLRRGEPIGQKAASPGHGPKRAAAGADRGSLGRLRSKRAHPAEAEPEPLFGRPVLLVLLALLPLKALPRRQNPGVFWLAIDHGDRSFPLRRPGTVRRIGWGGPARLVSLIAASC